MALQEKFERRVGDIRICVLGPLTVEHDGRELHVAGSHRRRLLAFLASRAGDPATAEAITDALWGEHPPPTVTKSIQNHVARLRGSFAGLDGELVETTAHGYRLAIEPDAVDAAVFERLAAQGRHLLADGDQLGAQSVLEEALALWRGEPYGDIGDTVFARAEAARLNELRWAAIEDLAQSRLELGEVEVVTADLERLVAEQPGRERSWILLIRALYSGGRQQDALAAYQRVRELLLNEFGLDPGAELRELEQRVLAQDPGLAIRRVPALPAALRRDRRAFVGRERERDVLVDAWRSAQRGAGQLRLLLGPVGSGRTRLATEVASVARGAPAQVVYVRGDEGFGVTATPKATNGATAGAVVDHITDLSRSGPVLVVVDDAEWGDAPTMTAVSALASVVERAPVLLLVIADSEGSGTAAEAVRRLDPDGDRTIDLALMTDEQLREIVTTEGLDTDAITAVVAVARGLPGLARREAAAWAERAASDRLAAAATSSLNASATATEARASVFDDVLALVAARARRDELASSALTGRQPYRALASYDVQDADLFVGRERLVAELVALVLARRFVAVIGASGTGKSSLVRAGLVALVRSGRLPGSQPWRAAVIVPGSDPIAGLDAVEGLDDPGPLLLVVDQFEEVFAAGVADVISARLVELSSDRALDVHVVVVVRADQYPAMATLPALGAVADDPHVIVGPPTDEELGRIVEVPARRTSCAVEPALTEQIARDVAGHDTALPLVSAALAEVWEVRDGDTLTLARYQGVGGLAAAVERMGARAIDAAGADAVRDVMLRLVDITDDGYWVRRRVAAADVPSHLEPALNGLVDARLVQRGDLQIDVVHEIVFVAWPQLVSWLEEVRADVLLDRDLRNAARAWDAGERDEDYLYRGARLAAAVEFLERHEEVDLAVAAFVGASRETAARVADEQAQRQAKVNRRLRSLLAGLAALLVLALVAGGLALRQAERADDSAAAARDEATRATARRAGDEARATTEIDRALLLAVEGVGLDDTPRTRANLLAVLGRHPSLIAPSRAAALPAVGASPDGTSVLTYADGRLALKDMESKAEIVESAAVPPVRTWSDVAFRPDGSQVAVLHNSHDVFAAVGTRTFAPRPVVLYDARTLGRARQQLGGLPERSAAQDVSFSADGRWIAVALALFRRSDDVDPFASPVFIWDLRSPASPALRIDSGALVNGVELSRDGGRLYVAAWPPGDVRAYDVATGRQVAEAAGVGGRFTISEDRRTIAVTGLYDGQVTVLDASTLKVRTRLTGRSLTPYDPPILSADGALVAAPDIDANVVYVWDVTSGAIVEELVGNTDLLVATWFAADGGTVFGVTERGTVLGWERSNANRFVQQRSAPADLVFADLVVPSDDGMIAYLSGRYGTPTPGGAVQLRAPGADSVSASASLPHNGVSALAWTDDGSRFASSGDDGTVRVWDPQGVSAPLRTRKLTDLLIESVAYLPDGRLAVTETNGETYALDGNTLADAGPHVDVPHPVHTVRPAWDDLVVGLSSPSRGATDIVEIVDLVAGRVVEILHAGFLPLAAEASPDRSRVAITGASGEMRIYTRDGGWLAPSGSAHRGGITSVSWSADSSLVATGGPDGTAALWDGQTGALLGALTPGSPGVAVAPYFTGDRDDLSIAAADGPIYTFDTDVDAWIDFACEVAGRNLTPAEWRETFDDRPYERTCG